MVVALTSFEGKYHVLREILFPCFSIVVAYVMV